MFVAALLALLPVVPAWAEDGWTPAAWTDENTVELRTTEPGSEPHWFPVWLAVIDGQLYVRLGSRAAGRFDGNATKPIVGVRIAGKTFRLCHCDVDVYESAKGVLDWVWPRLSPGGVVVRHLNHPYTLRLEPE
jgi:hypothetical protein